MDSSTAFLLVADAMLLLHVLFVAFVVLGLLLVIAGKAQAWSWIRNPWFRLIHLLAIGVVVAQAWLGIICPLTTFEMALRARAGDATYSGSFISHWLEAILYYQAPPWVFIVCYSLFGAAVIASWFWVRPRHFTNRYKS
ncbi:MAG: DUF2784 domain-containing protein, partial [Pseudomonadales bacterium]